MADPPYPFWSFRDDVYLESQNGGLVVHNRGDDVRIFSAYASVLEALRRMSLGPISLHNVLHRESEKQELYALLDGVQHLVVRSFGLAPAAPLISVVPLTQGARFRLPEAPLANPVRLSRFALIRNDGHGYCIESPLALHRVILHQDEAMAGLGELIRPVVPAATGPQAELIRYLMAAGMVVQAAGSDPFRPLRFAEDTDPALAAWTPFDLMFHVRSMLGRHDQDMGAIYPLGDDSAVEPVVKPAMAGQAIPLPRPDWDTLVRTDPPLIAAIEAGQRTGCDGEDAVMLTELAELLYRTARLRSLVGSGEAASVTATSDRPYPSSGGSYELELYAATDRCTGLSRGVYHYDPLRHALEPLDAELPDVDELLDTAKVLAGLDHRPPALLIITARFRRLSWKYNGLAYSLILKNVGALTQTLSLVSTATGLAACGLDGADIDVAARVFRLDWRVESSVGALVVSRRVAAKHPRQSVHNVNDANWADLANEALKR